MLNFISAVDSLPFSRLDLKLVQSKKYLMQLPLYFICMHQSHWIHFYYAPIWILCARNFLGDLSTTKQKPVDKPMSARAKGGKQIMQEQASWEYEKRFFISNGDNWLSEWFLKTFLEKFWIDTAK